MCPATTTEIRRDFLRRTFAILMIVILLSGCKHKSEPIDIALDLREALLTSSGTSFEARITADYEDVMYIFGLDCTEDQNGNLSFTVTEPESISGITGSITNDQYALTFDDKVLAFPPLSAGQLTPVIAPYLFLNSLRSGYISACGKDAEGYCIYIDDTFQGNQLHLQVFTDVNSLPNRVEITYRNLRILSIDISNFTLM